MQEEAQISLAYDLQLTNFFPRYSCCCLINMQLGFLSLDPRCFKNF